MSILKDTRDSLTKRTIKITASPVALSDLIEVLERELPARMHENDQTKNDVELLRQFLQETDAYDRGPKKNASLLQLQLDAADKLQRLNFEMPAHEGDLAFIATNINSALLRSESKPNSDLWHRGLMIMGWCVDALTATSEGIEPAMLLLDRVRDGQLSRCVRDNPEDNERAGHLIETAHFYAANAIIRGLWHGKKELTHLERANYAARVIISCPECKANPELGKWAANILKKEEPHLSEKQREDLRILVSVHDATRNASVIKRAPIVPHV